MRRIGFLGMLLGCCLGALAGCGDDECLECVDCPDFIGSYIVQQKITDVLYPDIIYHGNICGSKDQAAPRAFPFEVMSTSFLEDGQSLCLTMAGHLLEAHDGEPASLEGFVTVNINHPSDSRYHCNMTGNLEGYRF